MAAANMYAALDDLRRYLGLSAAQTSDDGLLWMFLEAAGRLIERHTGRRFYPALETRVMAFHTAQRVLLDDDLLDVHAVTNGDGTPIPLDAIRREPANQAVSSALVVDPAQAAFVPGDRPSHAIAVAGIWGYHPAWADAWCDSGDRLQNPLGDETGTGLLDVLDADGAGPDGVNPRFAVGRLLRLDDEYMQVRVVDGAANRLTVSRAVNGTTAGSHAIGAVIERYEPPADVRQVCLRVAGWLYRQKDAGFVQTALGLRGQVAIPPALPDDVQVVLAPFVRLRVA